jgi:hypothetical protein
MKVILSSNLRSEGNQMSETSNPKPTGKGKATPTRKQSEAANKRPLVGDRSKEAKKAARAAANARREEARLGMMAGEERYLAPRDKGVQKKFARDYVDSRFTVGELVLPSVFLALIFNTIENVELQIIVLGCLWALFVGIFINAWLLGRATLSALTKKYGAENIDRGIRMYVAMRSIQMRPMRLPKPQVKRGAKIG